MNTATQGNNPKPELTERQKRDIEIFKLETPEEIEIYLTQGMVHFEKVIDACQSGRVAGHKLP